MILVIREKQAQWPVQSGKHYVCKLCTRQSGNNGIGHLKQTTKNPQTPKNLRVFTLTKMSIWCRGRNLNLF